MREATQNKLIKQTATRSVRNKTRARACYYYTAELAILAAVMLIRRNAGKLSERREW